MVNYLFFFLLFSITFALDQFYLDEGDTFQLRAYHPATPDLDYVSISPTNDITLSSNISTFIWHYMTPTKINLESQSHPGYFVAYEESPTGIPFSLRLISKDESSNDTLEQVTCFYDSIELWRDDVISFELCSFEGWFLYWRDDHTLTFNNSLDKDEDFKDRISFNIILDDQYPKFHWFQFEWWPIITAGSVALTIIIIAVAIMIKKGIPDIIVGGMILGMLVLMGVGLYLGMIYARVLGMIIGMVVGMVVGSLLGAFGGYLGNRCCEAKKQKIFDTSYALM
jgi:hypothetical protein